MLIEIILVALILIVELIDVAHHWNTHEIDKAHTPVDCAVCLDRFARSLRSAGASGPIRANAHKQPDSTDPSPDHPVTGEECATCNASADSSSDAKSNASASRAFLSDQHRHVRQPFEHNRDSLR